MKNIFKLMFVGSVFLILSGCATAVNTAKLDSNKSTATTQESTVKTGQNQSAILISNFLFDPASVTVKVGDTVTWTNDDSAPHKIVSDDSTPVFSSGDLARGDSYSFTFTAVGTFNYHCQIHPMMKGTIIVK